VRVQSSGAGDAAAEAATSDVIGGSSREAWVSSEGAWRRVEGKTSAAARSDAARPDHAGSMRSGTSDRSSLSGPSNPPILCEELGTFAAARPPQEREADEEHAPFRLDDRGIELDLAVVLEPPACTRGRLRAWRESPLVRTIDDAGWATVGGASVRMRDGPDRRSWG